MTEKEEHTEELASSADTLLEADFDSNRRRLIAKFAAGTFAAPAVLAAMSAHAAPTSLPPT